MEWYVLLVTFSCVGDKISRIVSHDQLKCMKALTTVIQRSHFVCLQN